MNLRPHPLKARIRKLRITQIELASRTAIDYTTISKILSGRTRPTRAEEAALTQAVEQITAEIKESLQ